MAYAEWVKKALVSAVGFASIIAVSNFVNEDIQEIAQVAIAVGGVFGVFAVKNARKPV